MRGRGRCCQRCCQLTSAAVCRWLACLARDDRRAGEDRRGPEASNEEPNTERELPDGLGRCQCDGKSRGYVPGPQQHTDAREGQRATDEADHHQRPRKQSGSPHQVTQKNPVPEPGAELRAEKGGLVMYGEQSTGDVNQSAAVACGGRQDPGAGPRSTSGSRRRPE